MKKIVIVGGSGFIGKALHNKYISQGFEVHLIGRNSIKSNNEKSIFHQWDSYTLGPWKKALENADLLINLSGKSVNCRYTEENKREIFRSRTQTTELLAEALRTVSNPPKVWINSSSATIYRYAEDRAMDEETGEIGSGFSVEVCKAWEKSFFESDAGSIRKIALRIAIVLGKNDGVMSRYMNLVTYGLGGSQGSGEQYFSFIHIEDLMKLIDFLEEREDLEGVFNASAPNPEKNKSFMKHLRSIAGVSFGIPLSKFLLEIGARVIGTETELVLKSRRVVPTRALKEGFTFKFPTLEEALKDVI